MGKKLSACSDRRLEEFKQRLKEYIDDELNPLIPELEAMKYEAGRHGGKNPVADFPCAECGKLGISVLEDFYHFGRCCYCGMENDIYAMYVFIKESEKKLRLNPKKMDWY